MTLSYYLSKYGIAVMPVVRAANGERAVPHSWFARQGDIAGAHGDTPLEAVRGCVEIIKLKQRDAAVDSSKESK